MAITYNVYSSYGRGGEALANNRFGTTSASSIMTQLDTDMFAVCSKIKAQNVELYVTSFGMACFCDNACQVAGLCD